MPFVQGAVCKGIISKSLLLTASMGCLFSRSHPYHQPNNPHHPFSKGRLTPVVATPTTLRTSPTTPHTAVWPLPPPAVQ